MVSHPPIAFLIALVVLAVVIAVVASVGESALPRVLPSALAREPRSRQAAELIANAATATRSLAFVRVIAEVVSVASLTLVIEAWWDTWWLVLTGALLASIVVALVLVRASPRSLAARQPERALRWLGPLLVALIAVPQRVVVAARTTRPQPGQELHVMVDQVGALDSIHEEDRELLRSVVELGNTLAREVMVPRTDMVTVGRETTVDAALALFLRSGYSRIPVIGDSPDDLIGVAYFKDVVRALRESVTRGERPITDLARSAVFFPETKPVDDLLREMQAATSHMALVVDEYGGIAGLVTIEDALEEIVGELTDEHDQPLAVAEGLGNGSYRIPARFGLDDLGDLFNCDIVDEDVDTAGGLLAKALGRVPLPGSAATVAGLCLVAETAEGRRKQLATLLVSRAPHRDLVDGTTADSNDKDDT